jgi:hypothetical protein
MTFKRKILSAIVVVFAAIVGAIAILPGAANYLLLMLSVHDSVFPDTVSWDAKNAYLKCPGTIADPRQWPPVPQDACAAMELCLAEGALSDAELKSLKEQIRMAPRCEKPE